jgi:hypothetical protein
MMAFAFEPEYFHLSSFSKGCVCGEVPTYTLNFALKGERLDDRERAIDMEHSALVDMLEMLRLEESFVQSNRQWKFCPWCGGEWEG